MTARSTQQGKNTMTEQVTQDDDFMDAFGAALDDSSDSNPSDTPIDAVVIADSEQPDDHDTADGQQPDIDDPWANAPDTLRQMYQQEQQEKAKLAMDLRANSGRVAALNRKAEELQAKLAEAEKANGGPSANSGMPTAADLEGMSFEEIEQDFPEVARYLDSQLKRQTELIQQQVQQQLAPLTEMQQAYQQQAYQQQRQAEFQRLQQQHPDAQQIAADPAFEQWVFTQPDAVQQLYASTSADDNAVLLTLFKATTGRLTGSRKQSDPYDHESLPRKGRGSPVSARVPEDGDFFDLFGHHLNQSKRK